MPPCKDAGIALPEVSEEDVATAETRMLLAADRPVDGQILLERFPPKWRPLFLRPQKLSALLRVSTFPWFRVQPAAPLLSSGIRAENFDFRSIVHELLECPVEFPLEKIHEACTVSCGAFAGSFSQGEVARGLSAMPAASAGPPGL